MFAVYLARGNSEGVAMVLLLSLALCAVAILGSVMAPSTRKRLWVAFLVAALVGAGTGVAVAAPYSPHCDGVWKYINWLVC